MANLVQSHFEQSKVYVPKNLDQQRLIFAATDNIDFGNMSRDDKGSTHATNMILYQPGVLDIVLSQNTALSKPKAQLKLVNNDLYNHIDIENYQKPEKSAS